MTIMDLSDFFILTTKINDYRVYTNNINEKEVVNVLKNSNLDDKGIINGI